MKKRKDPLRKIVSEVVAELQPEVEEFSTKQEEETVSIPVVEEDESEKSVRKIRKLQKKSRRNT